MTSLALKLAICNILLYVVDLYMFIGGGEVPDGPMRPFLVIPYVHFMGFAFFIAVIGFAMAWQEHHSAKTIRGTAVAMGLDVATMVVTLGVFAAVMVKGGWM